MQLSKCDCVPLTLDRLNRPWWVRMLFRGRRLYRCTSCRKVLLLHVLR